MVFLRHQFYKLTDNQYSYIFLFNDSKLATNQKKQKWHFVVNGNKTEQKKHDRNSYL